MEIFGINKSRSNHKQQNKKINNAATDSFGDNIIKNNKDAPHLARTINNTPLCSSNPLTNVNPFLALNELEQEKQQRKLTAQAAKAILNSLNQIRLGILHGEFNYNHLQTIRTALGHHFILSQDPELNNLVNEIVLRAEIELAKLEQNIMDE